MCAKYRQTCRLESGLEPVGRRNKQPSEARFKADEPLFVHPEPRTCRTPARDAPTLKRRIRGFGPHARLDVRSGTCSTKTSRAVFDPGAIITGPSAEVDVAKGLAYAVTSSFEP